MKDNRASLALLLGKKLRNNRLEENLALLKGEVEAAQIASSCLETMLDACVASSRMPGQVVVEEAIQDCDELERALAVFSKHLERYRNGTDSNRERLVAGAG